MVQVGEGSHRGGEAAGWEALEKICEPAPPPPWRKPKEEAEDEEDDEKEDGAGAVADELDEAAAVSTPRASDGGGFPAYINP